MTNTKQVTVFGGTGFLGRYVIDRLCDLNFTVRVATRRPSGAYFLRTAGVVGQVVPVACDICDDSSIRHAIGNSTYVVNLIGILTEKGKKQRFDVVHHQFAERLAAICTEKNIERLVHISALGANENAPSKYAQTKAVGEEAVLAEFPNASILRPSVLFGPEDGFFNRFAQMALVSPFLPLIGGGHTVFQPVYVDDVAKAVVQCLTKPTDVQGKVFELGGDDKYSFRQVLEKILSLTHHKRRLVTVPFAVAKLKGAVLQHLPGQLLTVDQVKSLETDNILSGQKPGLRDLGIEPTPLDAILPGYMARYQAGGRFATTRAA